MELQRYSTGEKLKLDSAGQLGKGGEAHIYAVPQDSTLAAKVYHAPTVEREQKLFVMVDNPPDDPMVQKGHRSIAWPTDLLVTMDGTRRVVGFLMPRVRGMRHLIDFYNPRARRAQCPLFHTRYLHWTAHNVAAVMRALHDRGYIVGDVNESNILANERALATLVDTDSFQVRDPHNGGVHRCPVGKPDYTPPELRGQVFSDVDRTPAHDRFGLAVLIFMLLMEGTHPFAGRFQGSGDPPPYEERIASGHFPYSLRRSVPYVPGPLALTFDTLHPPLQDLFRRCFEEGHTHPQVRPHARTWQHALQKAAAALVPCAANDQHLYSDHLSNCPWCERTAQLRGRDPFPSKEVVRNGQYRQPVTQRPQPIPHPTQRQPIPPAQAIPPSPAPQNIWSWCALSFGLLSLVPLLQVWAGLAAVISGVVGRQRAQTSGRNTWITNTAMGLGGIMAILAIWPLVVPWVGERLQTRARYNVETNITPPGRQITIEPRAGEGGLPAPGPKVAVGTYTPQTNITNSIGMEFVLIPAGTFTMGSPDSDHSAYRDEKPAHQVTISQPFYMGKYEVTQGQWQAVMGKNPSRFKGDNRPVESVSWHDIQEFIQKLNAQEARVLCRLPTEAEWEYAAQAGSEKVYSFGNDPEQLGDYAWYSRNSSNKTHPVGQKKPNSWGLYDMHGNVWEWVQDWQGRYAAAPVTNPTGPKSGADRVLRGGGWGSVARSVRAADRNALLPGVRDVDLGFRCSSSGPSQ